MNIIASLHGPSAIGMTKMMCDARTAGGAAIEIFDEPQALLPELISGNVDFAVLPTSMAAMLYNKGIDYRIAAIMIWGGLYLCGTDSGIRELSDLRGKTVNVMAAGSPPESMLRHLLLKAGLAPDRDVLFDRRFPSHASLASAAEEGLVRLCILPEPSASHVVKAVSGFKALIDISEQWRKEEGFLPAITSFLVKGSIADNDKETVEGMTRVLRDSCDWVKGHPAEAASLAVASGLCKDAAAVELSIPRTGFDVRSAEESGQAVASFLSAILKTAPESLGYKIPDYI